MKKNPVISADAVKADLRRRYNEKRGWSGQDETAVISRQIDALAEALVDAVNIQLLRIAGRC